MTFVLQQFTEANQPKYDSLHLSNPLNTFRYPSDWVVDEVHDALMVEFGGRGDLPPESAEPPNFYAFVLHGQIVELEVYCSSKYSETGKSVLLQQIASTKVPKALSSEIEFVKSIIHEAFQALAAGRLNYSPEAVFVEFTKILYV